MDKLATEEPIVVLDYGCGGSPYRPLFPNADYRRADRGGEGEELDYVLDRSGKVKERDEVFDLILSTQVLEHVDSPDAYLGECYRLLKPGGLLYLTTHGSYPDHGCPDDFRRWTADGLARAMREAGFSPERLEKQTTGPRAFFLQFDYLNGSFSAPRRTVFGFSLYLFRRLFDNRRAWLHRMCDRHFAQHRVVTENLENHNVYAVAACLARKP